MLKPQWISLCLLACFPALSSALITFDPARPPALRLVREGQNLSALDMLRRNYEVCVLAARARGLAAQPPPVWAGLHRTRTEEFFEGVRYARYKHTQRYRFNDSCQLQITDIRRGEIDDGRFRYTFRVGRGQVRRTPSPAVTARQAQAGMERFARQQPQLAADTVTTLGVPELSTLLTAAAVGTDSVLSEPCVYIATNVTGRHRLCYWSTLRAYPGVVRRPIILKAVIPIGNRVNVEQAVVFEAVPAHDPRVFTPPR